MLAASHALIGASLANLIPSPIVAIPINLLLHFAADLIPHWDLHTRESKRNKTKVIIFSLTDAVIGFTLGILFFRSLIPMPYLLTMMFLAQLPDWIEAPYRIFDWNFPPFSSMKKLQSRLHHKLGLPWGLVIQLGIVALFVLSATL